MFTFIGILVDYKSSFLSNILHNPYFCIYRNNTCVFCAFGSKVSKDSFFLDHKYLKSA